MTLWLYGFLGWFSMFHLNKVILSKNHNITVNKAMFNIFQRLQHNQPMVKQLSISTQQETGPKSNYF